MKRRPMLTLLLFACGLMAHGCGYLVGGPYPPEVRTVHVPTFTSESFRDSVELQLTEAVHRQIQMRTPFRLADGPEADTRLTGHIVEIRKEVLTENRFDDPRELQFAVAVELRWEDLRSGLVLAERRIPIAPSIIPLVANASFAPEVGQSRATANQEAVDTLAREIVGMMEMPW